MATPLTADQLLAALRAEGVRVVEHPGWRTNNRNHVGPWGPVNGAMLHHTVTGPEVDAVALCYGGHADLPGPLCHGVIERDGVVRLVGNGRANHAGGGDPAVLAAVIDERYGDRPPAPHEHQGSAGAVDGNAHFYGFECANEGDGVDPWPAVQVEAMVRASAALCRAHVWSAKSTIGHLEWSDWKSDPHGPGDVVEMPALRSRIAERLAHAADWNPTVPDPEETEMPTPAEYAKAVWDHGISNRFRLGDDGKPRVIQARYTMEWADSHFDDLLAAIKAVPAPVLTDEQVAAFADRVAAHPAFAERIAELVAGKLAARLAE